MELNPSLLYLFSYVTQEDKNSDDAMTLLEAAMGGNPDRANKVLHGFPVILPWLELIGKANMYDWRHPAVAEALIMGSDMLDRPYDFTEIHADITSRFATKFRGNPPEMLEKGKHPHHNIVVGRYGIVSNPYATSEETLDCLVVPGRINLHGRVELIPSMLEDREIQLDNPFGIAYSSGD